VSDSVRVFKPNGGAESPAAPPPDRPRSNGRTQDKRAPEKPLAPSPPQRAATLPPRQPVGREASYPRELLITIPRSGNHQDDIAKLHLVYELLTDSGFQGNDRFKFHLVGGTQGDGNLELVFPNNRTRYCPELTQELVSILGPDCYTMERA
jgi:hypothetical protein